MISDDRLNELADKNTRCKVSWDERVAMAKELQALRKAFSEPVAYMTYKGYLIHAGDPKLTEYSEPEPLFTKP